MDKLFRKTVANICLHFFHVAFLAQFFSPTRCLLSSLLLPISIWPKSSKVICQQLQGVSEAERERERKRDGGRLGALVSSLDSLARSALTFVTLCLPRGEACHTKKCSVKGGGGMQGGGRETGSRVA